MNKTILIGFSLAVVFLPDRGSVIRNEVPPGQQMLKTPSCLYFQAFRLNGVDSLNAIWLLSVLKSGIIDLEAKMDQLHRAEGHKSGPLAFVEFFQQLPGEVDGRAEKSETSATRFGVGYVAMWIGLGLLLLLLPLYMLFLIRRKQIMAAQIAKLRAEAIFLFDQAPCGYHSVDEQGFIVNINQTLLQWLEYEKEEILGKVKFTDVVERTEPASMQKSVADGKGSGKVQLTLIKKSGGKFPVILNEVSADGLKKTTSKRLFITVDITDCEEALQRLRVVDQELESFSYSISHDLRAPLRSIDGYSRILQEDYGPKLGGEGNRVLNVIMSNAKRMGKLIDDLLEFGRLGRKPVQRSYCNMTGMVHSVVGDLRMHMPDRKIDVQVGGLHTAFADADMVHQVWHNLLDNALKFTGKKDTTAIAVRSYETGTGELCYEVRDNGVGFDMKYAHKLFGVFQRLHKIQDFGGTGVGLAIVKRIISRHGGRVWAEASPDNGAIFYFTIPMEDENT